MKLSTFDLLTVTLTLTLIFIFMKVVGYISWSWWLVLAPTLIVFGIPLAITFLELVLIFLILVVGVNFDM